MRDRMERANNGGIGGPISMEEENGFMQRANTGIGTRGQQYEPLPFEEQQVNANPYEAQSQFGGSAQENRQRIMQGLAPADWDDANAVNDKVQFSEQQNIKCSIEIKNGIPQRSLNNFHKNQNALVLNNYTVSDSPAKLLCTLVVS